MQIHNYCKTGGFHTYHGEQCQDEILWTTAGSYDIAVLADGVSDCSQGKRGAQLACAAVVDFIRMEKENVFLYTPRKLSYLVMEHILYFIEMESFQNGTAVCDYASTIAFICVDNKSGKMITFSLGDGAIIHLSGNEIQTITGSRRYYGNPVLTTTEDAYKYVEIQKLPMLIGNSVLLCTDGFLHAMGSNDACRRVLQEAMLQQGLSELDILLNNTNEPDDISYIHYTRIRR